MYSNLVSRYSTIKVKCPKTGEKIEARFTRLAIDPCIYRYEDAMGRIMLICIMWMIS